MLRGEQGMSPFERLEQQLAFIVEIDKLKSVYRQSHVISEERRENDAEHSWHLAIMAFLLQEHAAEPVEIGRVVHMLLIHDLVEIDAGDTFAYDEKGHEDKAEREERAAERLFAMLPEEQCREAHALWREFEERQTPESRYAAALDRLQPLLQNMHTQGAAWRKHGIRQEQVMRRNRHIAEGAPALWEAARRIIAEAVAKGYLAP